MINQQYPLKLSIKIMINQQFSLRVELDPLGKCVGKVH